MKTTLDIPDALAAELNRHAEHSHRTLDDICLSAIMTGLAAMGVENDVLYAQDLIRQTQRRLERLRLAVGPHAQHQPLNIQTDATTGLPVIISPPSAPIHSMTIDEVLALEQSTLEEEDLDRAGLPLRH
jgi:hypothetical protein